MEYELPKTLIEAVNYFSIAENCSEFVKRIHWSEGNAKCPQCGSADVVLMAKYQRYHCKECRKQFSIKLGTIFEHSPLPLSKWLPIMWLMCNAKNGESLPLRRRSYDAANLEWCGIRISAIAEVINPTINLNNSFSFYLPATQWKAISCR